MRAGRLKTLEGSSGLCFCSQEQTYLHHGLGAARGSVLSRKHGDDGFQGIMGSPWAVISLQLEACGALSSSCQQSISLSFCLLILKWRTFFH